MVGDEFNERHAEGRLANVEVLMAENNELELSADTFDAVTVILSYHDIYYADPENGWPKIDGPDLLAQIYKGLKPGGVLGVVDHYAEAGSPRETGNSVHRIDPGIVISELETAGFVLDDKSQILRNMDDDYSKIVFDPTLRFTTDKCLDAIETVDAEFLDVASAFRAAVAVNRIDLYPQTVVPIGASRLRQPCADRHKEQYQ